MKDKIRSKLFALAVSIVDVTVALKLVLDPDVDINYRDETTPEFPIFYACIFGLTDVVRELVKRDDFDPNVIGRSNIPSLLFAAANMSRVEIMKLLVAHPKTNVNIFIATERRTALY